MGSFSISEVLTILVVILVIFGPEKLPEFARKTGQLIAKSRQAMTAFTAEFESHYGDAAAPIQDLTNELGEVKKDLTRTVTNLAGGTTPESSDQIEEPPSEDVDLSGGSDPVVPEEGTQSSRPRTISVVPDSVPSTRAVPVVGQETENGHEDPAEKVQSREGQSRENPPGETQDGVPAEGLAEEGVTGEGLSEETLADQTLLEEHPPVKTIEEIIADAKAKFVRSDDAGAGDETKPEGNEDRTGEVA